MQISLAWLDYEWGKSRCTFQVSNIEHRFGHLLCTPLQRQSRKKEIKVTVKKREESFRGELEGIRVHIPEVLLEGAGTLIISSPASVTVRAPGCERWRPRPEHAAPPPDTSPSSAACGFETSPRFAGHRELHLGKSIGLQAETHRHCD